MLKKKTMKRNASPSNEPAKKGKLENDYVNSFELELAKMQQGDSVKWSRPPVCPLNPSKDTLCFQQIDFYHDTDNRSERNRIFGVTEEGNSVCCHVHGSDPDFVFQTVGCAWIELKPTKWKLRGKYGHDLPLITTCQLEVDVAEFISHVPEGEWSKVAPFRILSFDIECAGRKDIFPQPEHDPVIQIANMVINQGETKPFLQTIFTLNTCDTIFGCEVLSFDTESEMLKEWAEFIRQVDPDIFTGYNINSFDFPYLINRAEHLHVKTFSFLGRIKNNKPVITDTVFHTQQYRNSKIKSIHFDGRVPFDLYLILVRDYKLKSYKLSEVSHHFLQEAKEDVHFSIIPDLQNGDAQTRKRLAIYCLKDAYLPLKLIDKLKCIITYMKKATFRGVSLSSLFMGLKK